MSNSMLDKNKAILIGGGALLLGLIVLFYLAYRPKPEVLQGFFGGQRIQRELQSPWPH